MTTSRRSTIAAWAGVILLLAAIGAALVFRGSSETARPVPEDASRSVLDFGAVPNDAGDDSRAFTDALDAASRAPREFAPGPSGPQSVVRVPAGTYRLRNVEFSSNVRLELSSRSVIALPEHRYGPAFVWREGVKNVSIVGVADGDTAKPGTEPGWDTSRSFTFNLDPGSTGAGNEAQGLLILGASDFLVENVYAIQSDACPRCGAHPPNSNSPVISLRAENGSKQTGPRLPRSGSLRNLYAVHAPRGYGIVQFNAGIDIRADAVFSSGGVALRVETHAPPGRFSIVDDLQASRVECRDGNAAVVLSPHEQRNGVVVVRDVRARGCTYGVKVRDGCDRPCLGVFSPQSRISDVSVTRGPRAQVETGYARWREGPSQMGVLMDANRFNIAVANVHCNGLPSDVPC